MRAVPGVGERAGDVHAAARADAVGERELRLAARERRARASRRRGLIGLLQAPISAIRCRPPPPRPRRRRPSSAAASSSSGQYAVRKPRARSSAIQPSGESKVCGSGEARRTMRTHRPISCADGPLRRRGPCVSYAGPDRVGGHAAVRRQRAARQHAAALHAGRPARGRAWRPCAGSSRARSTSSTPATTTATPSAASGSCCASSAGSPRASCSRRRSTATWTPATSPATASGARSRRALERLGLDRLGLVHLHDPENITLRGGRRARRPARGAAAAQGARA